MQKIKAAVAHEFGAPLVVEDVQLRAPEGSEVEVQVDAVGVRSDGRSNHILGAVEPRLVSAL